MTTGWEDWMLAQLRSQDKEIEQLKQLVQNIVDRSQVPDPGTAFDAVGWILDRLQNQDVKISNLEHLVQTLIGQGRAPDPLAPDVPVGWSAFPAAHRLEEEHSSNEVCLPRHPTQESLSDSLQELWKNSAGALVPLRPSQTLKKKVQTHGYPAPPIPQACYLEIEPGQPCEEQTLRKLVRSWSLRVVTEGGIRWKFTPRKKHRGIASSSRPHMTAPEPREKLKALLEECECSIRRKDRDGSKQCFSLDE